MKEIRSVLEEAGLDFFTNQEGNYVVSLEFNDNRFQNVFISGKVHEHNNVHILIIWSPACDNVNKLEPEIFRKCLANNNKQVMGAWELFGNTLVFSVKTVFCEKASVLRSIIGFIGATTDEFERKFMGKDEL